MKKLMLFLFVTVSAPAVFAQEEPVKEERSSAWLKVTGGTSSAQKPRTTAVSKPRSQSVEKKADPQPATPPKTNDPFNSTNNQVKRFKKKTKG